MTAGDIQIRGAHVLTPDGFRPAGFGVSDGLITSPGAGRAIDLGGFLVLPGIVDLHGDGFEHHIAPRRGAVQDPATGLMALDAVLASNGITTAVLAQFYSWEGGIRSPEFTEKLLTALSRIRPRLITDMRVQLRLETHLPAQYDHVLDLVDRFDISYVVFNDHLPHEALAEGRRPPRLTGQALKSGRSPEAHLAYLKALHDQREEVAAALPRLARELQRRGVRMGSHDDATTTARTNYRDMGADICEFPLTEEIGQAARATGDAVILGAPNVVRGGSHSGGLRAETLIARGGCDALVSDYHYPSPRLACLRLAGGPTGLDRHWHLVSSGPASVLGLTDRGRLTSGCRADFVVLDPEKGEVQACFTAGRAGIVRGEVAERLLAA